MAQAYVPAGNYIQGATQLFDRLNGAGLPETLRAQITDTLTILLEDDGETVPPNAGSFSAFISFLAGHRDYASPSFGVNRDGIVVARWRQPGFQLSYEFEPAGTIHWLVTEFPGGVPSVRDGRGIPEKAPCRRGSARSPKTCGEPRDPVTAAEPRRAALPEE